MNATPSAERRRWVTARGQARDLALLRAIEAFQAKHGYAPVIRDLMALTGIASSSTVHYGLKSLRRRGFITWPRGLVRAVQAVKTVEELEEAWAQPPMSQTELKAWAGDLLRRAANAHMTGVVDREWTAEYLAWLTQGGRDFPTANA